MIINPALLSAAPSRFVSSHPIWVCHQGSVTIPTGSRCARPGAVAAPPRHVLAVPPPRTRGGRGDIHLLGHSCPGETRLPPGNRCISSHHKTRHRALNYSCYLDSAVGERGASWKCKGKALPTAACSSHLVSSFPNICLVFLYPTATQRQQARTKGLTF